MWHSYIVKSFLPNYKPGNTVKSLNADYLIFYVVIQELVQVLERLFYFNPFEQYEWHNGINNNLYKPSMDPKESVSCGNEVTTSGTCVSYIIDPVLSTVSDEL